MGKSRKMIVPQKIFESNEGFQSFIDAEKAWMYNRIVEAITESFKSGKNIANILEAKIENTMSLITVNSDMNEWVESLNLAMEWYVSEENYEKCVEIRDLIKSIQDAEP
jgi:protein-arginine kinase activator protein McsA